VQACGVTFLDPGGNGNYNGYQNISMRVNPEEGKKVKVSFSSFRLGAYDYLNVYDGEASTQNLIGSFTGTTLPPDLNALNSMGYLTFFFYSSGSTPSAGWQATLSCIEVPNAPTNLIASTSSGNQVNLTWQDNSTTETSFAIERKTIVTTAQFINVATVGANTTGYSDQGLPTNERYLYRIKALNGTAYSPYSNTADVQLGNAPILMSNGTISTCDAQFFDSGYINNYSNGENYTLTVNPSTSGQKMRITFSSLSLESCCDALYIYDGPSTNSRLIGTFNGSALPPVITATNSEGSLTFRFYSDGSVTSTGWQATLACIVVPNPPTNLIASVFSSTQINLTWQDNSSDETSFILERKSGLSPNAEFSTVATLSANTTTYSDQGLPTNQKYYYRVRAFNGAAYSFYSNISDATLGTPPLVMQNGVVQACGISFLDPGGEGNYNGYQYITMRVNPEEGKKVKVSFSSFSLGAYDYLNIYDGEALTQNLIGSFTGTTLPPDINALNSMGYLTFFFYSGGSTPSAGWQAILSCVEIPSAATNLIASASSGTQVNLSWQDNSTNETGFSIERKLTLGNSQFVSIATVASNVTSYSDQALPTDTRYSYRIRARNGSDYSSYSNTADVQLGNAPIIMGNGTLSTCNALFFDSGHASNYSNNENYTLTINPSTIGGKVKVTFTSFSLESGFDALYIYDGPSTNSTLIGTYTGGTIPPVITATNSQGNLTFRFYSDGSVTFSGWQAGFTCVTPTPVITFNDINKVFGDSPFDLNATAYPGANFIYTIADDNSNTGEVSFSGVGNKTVSILKSGTIKIRAFLPAVDGYSNAEKIATLNVTKGLPSITFNDLTKTFGDAPFNLSATAYTGAVFSYSTVSDPTNTAQVSLSGVDNKTVTITKAGIIKLKASLTETDNYSASEKVITLTIGKATPVIAFNDLNKTFGDTQFNLNATAYTGAVFSYGTVSDPTNTAQVSLSGVDNKTVTITKAGIIKLKASLTETDNYSASEKVITLAIGKVTPVIAFNDLNKDFWRQPI
jgi:hypothetical protein